MRAKIINVGTVGQVDRDRVRMEPMIDYFMQNYWGLTGSRQAMLELGDMVQHGVKLDEQLVDFVARKHVRLEFVGQLKEAGLTDTPQRRAPADLPTWVYFIRVDDRVKIGRSKDPAARAVALSLRVNNIVAVMEGDQKLESSLHRRFAQHRIDDTEWFWWRDEIAAFIDTYADRFTRDHRAYRPGAPTTKRSGYESLAAAIGWSG